MTPRTLLATGCCLAAAPALHAATSFDADTNSDFTLADNWDNGLPTINNGGTIDSGLTADLAAAYSLANGNLTVGRNGTAGTLNINSGGSLTAGTFDLTIGRDAGSTGTLNINNGTFFIDHAATYATNQPQDELTVGAASTLAFSTDGSAVATIASSLNSLDLSAGSTLDLQLDGAFSVGDTWTLITGITAFNGTFTNIIDSTNPDHQFTAYYGTTPAGTGELVVELTQVPEPASAALLGLGTLLIARRRRA